ISMSYLFLSCTEKILKKNPEKYILNLAHELAQNYRIQL
ncbi:hypothetical protein RG455_003849, partial [Acinetobacter baumannii]